MAASVFPFWMTSLPMQQQSVLLLAARGPDGVGKFHPTKIVWRHYRACVLKSAWHGRSLRPGEGGGNEFMSLELFNDRAGWKLAVRDFFEHADSIAHHCRMHLMHGAEILGYKHPEMEFKGVWHTFYLDCVDDLHLRDESEADMDLRLNDWARLHWDGEPT